MPNFSRRLLVVAALGALALAGCSKSGGAADAADMTLGDPKAPVKITEYASASCTHCATFNNEVFPALKAKYIDTGKVTTFIIEPREAGRQAQVTITTDTQVRDGIVGKAQGWMTTRLLRPIYIKELEQLADVVSR